MLEPLESRRLLCADGVHAEAEMGLAANAAGDSPEQIVFVVPDGTPVGPESTIKITGRLTGMTDGGDCIVQAGDYPIYQVMASSNTSNNQIIDSFVRIDAPEPLKPGSQYDSLNPIGECVVDGFLFEQYVGHLVKPGNQPSDATAEVAPSSAQQASFSSVPLRPASTLSDATTSSEPVSSEDELVSL